MEMQGLQEMQADDGCILSSGFIHPSVVTEKLAANVHKMNFLPAASFWNRLAFQLSAHDVYSFANGIKQSRGVASPRRNKIRALGFYLWGSSSRPQTGGQLSPMEASIEGRFRFSGKKPDLRR